MKNRLRNIIRHEVVSFVRQLGWATRCPGIWIDIISGGWVRVLPDEASIGICGQSKADGLQVWAGLPQSTEGLDGMKA